MSFPRSNRRHLSKTAISYIAVVKPHRICRSAQKLIVVFHRRQYHDQDFTFGPFIPIAFHNDFMSLSLIEDVTACGLFSFESPEIKRA